MKSGLGSLLLTGTNAFTGGLTLNSGNLQFTVDANLGAAGAALTLNSGQTGALTYQPANLFAAASAATETINRPITIGLAGTAISVPLLDNNLTIGGVISGSGQLLKLGGGIVTLTGANTWTGNIVSTAGTVAFSSDGALGDPTNNLIVTNGVIQPTASFPSNRNILFAGTGSTPLPYVNTGVAWTVSGNLTSQNTSATPLKDGGGDLILTGTNTFSGGYQNGLSGAAPRGNATFASPSSGRTILSGPNGSMALAASFFVIAGGEIVLDNSGVAANINNNRIGNVTVALTGGNLRLIGNANGAVTEEIGAVSISNGNNQYGGNVTIETRGGGQVTTLKALSFTNQAAPNVGTLFVRGDNLGAASGDRTAMVLSANPTQSNGLITGMVGATVATSEPTDFLTTTTVTVAAPNSNQFALTPFATYTAGTGALAAGSATATYDVTAAATFAGASAANALRIKAGGSVDLGGGVLTSTSGMTLATGGANGGITNGTLAYGAATARFIVGTGSDLTVNAAITGTAGLVKTGGGVLTLSNAAGATGITAGNFGVGQGTLRYGVANVLPTTSFIWVNSGATLDIAGTNSTIDGISGYGNVNIGAGGTLTLNVGTTPTQPHGGALVGSGTFIKTGLANQTLAGTSPSFTGAVQVLGGTNTGTQQSGLILTGAGALGTGTSPILLGDTTGTNQASMALGTAYSTFTRDITVQAGSTPGTPHTLAVGNETITISSNIILGQQLRITNYSNVLGNGILTGTISGAGALNVFFGSWSFNGNNTYAGGTTFDSGSTAAYGLGSDSTATTGPLGTGSVAFTAAGGFLRPDGGARVLNNALVLQSAAIFGVAGTNNLTLGGTVDMSGATQTLLMIGTGTTIMNGIISNGTGINKNGPGILALGGNNTYTGTTTVNAGTLLINNTTGTGTGQSSVVVNTGAILGGSGTIGDAGARTVTVSAGGIVRPGSSLNNIGTLTISSSSNTTFAGSSTLQVNVGSSTSVGGKLALTGGGTTDLSSLSVATPLNVFLFNTGGISNFSAYTLTVIDSAAIPIVFPAGGFNANLFSVTANFPVQSVTVTNPTTSTIRIGFTPVPEPAMILLLAGGAAGAVGWLRRRKLARG